MTTGRPGDVIAACDYLDAVMAGEPEYAAMVAAVYTHEAVARGALAVLVLLCTEAARESGATPRECLNTMRRAYVDEGAES